MSEVEKLDIDINALDNFSRVLDELVIELGEVAKVADTVDPIEINAKVNDRQLRALEQRLARLEAMDFSDMMGDVVIGDKRVTRRSGGGRGISRSAESAMEGLGETLGPAITDIRETLNDLDATFNKAEKSMAAASEGAEEAAESARRFNLSMSDVNNAVAKLIPLLLVVVASLPAVIGAFATLAAGALAAAAALTALGGFAALGLAAAEGGGDISEGFLELAREVQQDFLDAFMPLARELAPIFDNALDGLGMLFERIADQGGALKDLTDEARAFGGFILDTLPTFLADVARFAEAMSPVLGLITDFFGEIDVFKVMADFLADALPPFMGLMRALFEMAPIIFQISIGFLQIVGAIVSTVAVIARLMSLLPISQQLLGALAGAILTAVTAILIWNTSIMLAARSLFANMIPAIIQGVRTLFTYVPAALTATSATNLLTGAMIALGKAILAVMAVSGIGILISFFGGIAASALSASSEIDKATQSLKEFKSVGDNLDDTDIPAPEEDITRGRLAALAGSGGGVNIRIEDNRNSESNDTRESLRIMGETT